MAHPSNTGLANGRITDQIGYVCSMPEFFPKVIFMENKHGMCECWQERDYEKYDKKHTFEALSNAT